MKKSWQFKVTLTCSDQGYTVNNSTPYHVTISDANTQKKGLVATGFKLLVMPPKTSQPLKAKMASAPVLAHINDYDAHIPLIFHYEGNTCKMDED